MIEVNIAEILEGFLPSSVQVSTIAYGSYRRFIGCSHPDSKPYAHTFNRQSVSPRRVSSVTQTSNSHASQSIYS